MLFKFVAYLVIFSQLSKNMLMNELLGTTTSCNKKFIVLYNIYIMFFFSFLVCNSFFFSCLNIKGIVYNYEIVLQYFTRLPLFHIFMEIANFIIGIN